jgi:P-type Ca2+ transporter type 2C
VFVEPGDRIPADGRLLAANNLEVEEAALTGESLPATKSTAADPVDAPVADRRSMVFMQSTVTRGRAELVVVGTGMATEIGRIAHLLQRTGIESTPLQRQLDRLAKQLAVLAGIIVGAVFTIGLARGQEVADLLLTSVALAVATIPEGLPAVTAITLAIGVSKMAEQHAIVKHLASVETLGCTTVICSDKTGTLTLNQMTAREVVFQFVRYEVTGQGYDPDGTITPRPEEPDAEQPPLHLHVAMIPLALCADAEVHLEADRFELVGDPTEGALVTLAAKSGLDVARVRRTHPRLGEVPFDSATRLMATVHQLETSSGRPVVRIIVKGALDALLARASTVLGSNGTAVPIGDLRDSIRLHHDAMADEGLRVIVVAQRDLELGAWSEFDATGAPVMDLVGDLTLVAMVGIVDPPRSEARTAIASAHSAGIRVKVITGDHAATAMSIGNQLGLRPHGAPVRAITGAELARLDDDELARQIDDIDLFARVAPEHKMRLVSALQARGEIVAMTGDGVNDAPALKRADIGIAMGITGTEVAKEAAEMVLTDDNFATIVVAVSRGRAIYDNIVKFVRFQLSTTIAFATLFLLAAILDIAGGKPFAAIPILWVNIIIDGPPAIALGVDPAGRDVMSRSPRPPTEPILTRSRRISIGLAAVVMSLGTLAVLNWAPGTEAEAGTATTAGTMAFTTFVLFQVFNLLNVRSERQTVFSRETGRNRWLWWSVAVVVALQILVTTWAPLQDVFDMTSLGLSEWFVCTLVASTVLWAEELRKLLGRVTSRATDASVS